MSTFSLPDSVYSPEQLIAYALELERYVAWLRSAQIQQKYGAKDKAAAGEPTLSAELIKVIETWQQGKKVTPTSLEELSQVLRGLKDQAPTVHITLAAVASPAVRQALVDWFRKNISPQLLISFIANRNIGGGLIVRTDQRIYDYSFRQLLISKRDAIPRIVHDVR